MNKIIMYIILIIIIVGLLTYFFGEMGLLTGLIGFAGLGSNEMKKLKKQAEEFDEKAKVKKEELKTIEEAQKKLISDGVEDKTPEEEKDYWKNQ